MNFVSYNLYTVCFIILWYSVNKVSSLDLLFMCFLLGDNSNRELQFPVISRQLLRHSSYADYLTKLFVATQAKRRRSWEVVVFRAIVKEVQPHVIFRYTVDIPD
jgi:hypothetical protein